MIRKIVVAVALVALASCADHASMLRSKIDAAAVDLDHQTGDSTKTISFSPTSATRPYTIIFFPERRVFETELIARGVDAGIAKRIYQDLSRYGVGEKERPMVVVAEPGKAPSFESYSGHQIVHVDELLIASKPGGAVELTLQKHGDTYYLTDLH